ncbi:N-acetylglutamate synthase [Buchnera aphidicola (Nipponaphis monzeni)]|uniref:Amino-acid acetyltransferase n=1 Tax=Buchnera aphidicola (Nipponaphis monzeni) TaxID=2495405 RepID=A0A455TAL8_9GAMM|nr:amino-acid N-acetyltransferase [Buchnera aphidicola]BBI01350.1 N-acetylglutamate synthase [Buchnera aphidicola (Nipponaphis monzeni)]
MDKLGIKLIQSFRHSSPYINTHRGKTFVIMLNGETIENVNFSGIINDIGLLHSLGIKLIVVYGIYPKIDSILLKHKMKIHYHKYIRITDYASLQQIKKISGKLQLDITAKLSMSLSNTPLQGSHINVVSGNFVIAQPLGVNDGVDYLNSGKIRKINKKSIESQLNNNNIVLIGPIAASVTGESFNLISEEIATEVAIALKVEKIVGFCKEKGLVNTNGKTISELFPNTAKQIIKQLMINQFVPTSLVRFLIGAIKACNSGIPRSHIISYYEDGALLQELFSRDGIGTQMVMKSSENIRMATINDIGGILELIRPLENKGILVRRSREQLEMEIDKFIIIEKDNLTIGCAALYIFPKEKMGEMACVAVHPDYRNSSRGELLVNKIKIKAKELHLKKIFVLTTQSIHWFREKGFIPIKINFLPDSKKKMYNYQRGSKMLIIDVN